MNDAMGKVAILGGSVMLASAGALTTLPIAANEDAAPSIEVASEAAFGEAGSAWDAVDHVEGAFSYNQDAVTPNSTIVGMFNKAASALCASLPNYGADAESAPIEVSSDAGARFAATVEDMAQKEGSVGYVMACACASNIAGGGAIANAEVEGVSLESVAELAEAW